MKKSLLTLIILFSAYCLSAQTIEKLPISTTNYTNIDTVPNAGTRSQVIKVGNASSVRIQANLTKLSGAAGGVVTIQGSQDGVNYEPIPSYLSTGAMGSDTLAVANVTTQSHSFIMPVVNHNYYKVVYTGASTMSVKFSTFETEVISPVYFKP